MTIDLKNDVFAPVLARVKKRRALLRNMKRFPNSGIEGWFKVEIIAVLGDRVEALKNKGPDLLLKDGTKVELKAGTNFSRAWFVEPIRKYDVPCLFLGDGTGQTEFPITSRDDFEVVGCQVFSDGSGEWMISLLKPRP